LHTNVVFTLERQGKARKLYEQQDIAFLVA